MRLFSAEAMYLVIAVGVFATVALVLAVDFLWPQRGHAPAEGTAPEGARAAEEDALTPR